MSIIPITFSFFFLFILGDVFSVPTTKHLCRPEQRDSLLQFKSEFNIGKCISYYDFNDPHPKTESWTNKSDCCYWEGITCNAESGEVIELDLSSSCLYGQFHSNSGGFRLQNLHFLTTLDLSFNCLTGQNPLSIGNLSHLANLYLSSNQLLGSIPSSIGNLSRLANLDLSSNKLSGSIISLIENLFCLTTLYLFDNQLSGPISSSIGNLSRLTYLYLSINQFSGTILSNQFSDQLPSSIGKFSRLTTLDIYNNKIKGQVPAWLWTLPNLEYLTLSKNTFIGFERSSKHGQSSIRTPTMMKHFLGSNNNFMGKIPSFICELRSLITLDLSNNNFSGSIPSCIGNLKNTLSVLDLRRNRLGGGLPEDIFESLRFLDVGHNQLVGKLPRSLIRFSSLEVLNVESNKISDIFPFWLSSLKELKILLLRFNVFYGPIHQTSFPKLQIIDISHNHFSGTLSSDYFSKWIAMSAHEKNEDPEFFTLIDFSVNKFEGKIPRSIGILQELHSLNLSNNAFSGHIPSSMGNLISLETLDVSQNKLSGKIPQELGHLSNLSYMNFSHNQLRGLVPGDTFGTQPCSSFEDNMGLFGPSLDKACRSD